MPLLFMGYSCNSGGDYQPKGRKQEMMEILSEEQQTIAIKLLQAYQYNRDMERKLAKLLAAGNEIADALTVNVLTDDLPSPVEWNNKVKAALAAWEQAVK